MVLSSIFGRPAVSTGQRPSSYHGIWVSSLYSNGRRSKI